MNAALKPTLQKRAFASRWLEYLGALVDLTDAQLTLARERYESVGRWLATSDHLWLAGSSIFAHGSIALGTAKRPIGGDEFDVDLVTHLISAPASAEPRIIKNLVGARLWEHATYRPMLEEKPRCWRLNYQGAFHLDITPAVTHPSEPIPALLVPDKPLKCWMPSNPIGFRERFEARAALSPRWPLFRGDAARADVEPFPMQAGPKGILRRIVQLLKHHRDQAFQSPELTDLRPISIILTTLAAWSYERSLAVGAYQTEYDLILTVIEGMPDFIQVTIRDGQPSYLVANETVRGENFADKWNRDARLPRAFFTWHAQVLAALHELIDTEGLDVLAARTSRHFGAQTGERVLEKLTRESSAARASHRLTVARGVGLAATALAATPVRPNTFFGRAE
jgi:hypothetical protein